MVGVCAGYNKQYPYAEQTPSVAFGASSLEEGAKRPPTSAAPPEIPPSFTLGAASQFGFGLRPSLRMTGGSGVAALTRAAPKNVILSVAPLLRCGVEPEGRGNASGSKLR